MRRTFVEPVPWGLGPGPTHLHSVGGALCAVGMWLELTPVHPETMRERNLMLALRDMLTDVPDNAGAADLESARIAIEGMVAYSSSREAEDARIDAQMRGERKILRRPRARSNALADGANVS